MSLAYEQVVTLENIPRHIEFNELTNNISFPNELIANFSVNPATSYKRLAAVINSNIKVELKTKNQEF